MKLRINMHEGVFSQCSGIVHSLKKLTSTVISRELCTLTSFFTVTSNFVSLSYSLYRFRISFDTHPKTVLAVVFLFLAFFCNYRISNDCNSANLCLLQWFTYNCRRVFSNWKEVCLALWTVISTKTLTTPPSLKPLSVLVFRSFVILENKQRYTKNTVAQISMESAHNFHAWKVLQHKIC